MKNPFARGSQMPNAAAEERVSWFARIKRWCTCSVEQSLGILVLIIVIAGLWKLGAGYGLLPSADFPSTDRGKWQAVFLVNNQVYFGHLKNYNRGYALLKDVYYLQVTTPLQPQEPGAPPQLNLVKLGGELHGPEDRMLIPKDRILFWEDMKSDSQVVQAILSTRR